MLTMKQGDKIILKSTSAFSKEEIEKENKNYRSLNILFRGLNSNEFNHVFECDTTKEVWGILKTIYVGTSQV